LIFAVEPKCSALVNLSRQSSKEVGGPDVSEPEAPDAGPKSKDMSQNGSIVVDTPLKQNDNKYERIPCQMLN